MAKCKVCGKEMLKADGCLKYMYANGKRYKRILVGGKGDFFEGSPTDIRCGDCGALMGHYHHWGCDCERCPACGLQLIDCDCENVYVEG